MPKNQQLDKLRRLLMQEPQKTAAILATLDISQPTFSRLWSTVSDGFVIGAARARSYALLRQVAGVDAPIPVFRVTEQGQIESIGNIDPLQGAYYALTGKSSQLFQGMPYFLSDLRPQGFLGRMEPGKNPDLDLPADILRWTDEHVLKYISRRSEHAAGDLILGNESYARYLAAAGRIHASVIQESQRQALYPAMAENAMQGEPPGSSAGGEQPKFTAIIQRHAQSSAAKEIEHVIVKFSPPVDTANGRRWADLLICEHLALETLANNQIAAAKTALLEAGGRVFLEVVRFDRVGLKGRRPMATFAAMDGDLGMLDQKWTAVARELARMGQLPATDEETVEILDLYGTLIGNTDKHHGNIALAWTFEQRHHLLPAYDMLPMFYRPNAHGEIVPRAWVADLAAGLELRHLPRCHDMAHQFWTTALNDKRISQAYKDEVAGPHLNVLCSLINMHN
ncbi:type II toxin-antitoxin system HipA family toxin YjjJ [Undibacterium sp. Ji42W]|uniref:type II toxin-antitoxin system HipA family toxin YjjJ n=1 Tax=Undibacterium sp. Ji42W TaxID=3413039 RepID=UPI003BF2733D